MRPTVATLLLAVAPALALEPRQIVVVANSSMPESLDVAKHYAAKRGLKPDQIVALDLPKGEDISRADFDAKLAGPLRKAIGDRRDSIDAILCVYGVPLRVGGASPTDDDRAEMAELAPKRKEADAEVARRRDDLTKLEADAKAKPSDELKKTIGERKLELTLVENRVRALDNQRKFLEHAESQASVDSELMLLWWPTYDLRRWVWNTRYFLVPESSRKHPVLIACRLDGPTPDVAKRLVDDAIAVEKRGLKGKVYIDARGIGFDPKTDAAGTGYGGYDESMRETARLLEKQGKMTVVLDDKNELFGVGKCPECALYCGWYSHANFIDSCKLEQGAVAWHLASSEAVSLRRADAKFWCKNLLEKGACATLGPVAEPYTLGFPKPAEFFGFLATGKYTLGECYAKTVMLNSWMGTLIGDPLYNPYANDPRLKEDDVKPSPAGARRIPR